MAAWGDASLVDERLHLPRPNPFIPTDFSLHESEAWEGEPKVVLDEANAIRVHHKCDMTFRWGKKKVPDGVLQDILYLR